VYDLPAVIAASLAMLRFGGRLTTPEADQLADDVAHRIETMRAVTLR
jgi:hypothetical protein